MRGGEENEVLRTRTTRFTTAPRGVRTHVRTHVRTARVPAQRAWVRVQSNSSTHTHKSSIYAPNVVFTTFSEHLILTFHYTIVEHIYVYIIKFINKLFFSYIKKSLYAWRV